MIESKLGPWPRGMVNTVTATSIGNTALADAVNVDIDIDGTITNRGGWERIHDLPTHSLFERNGRTYGVVDGWLGELTHEGFDAALEAPTRVAWAVLNDEPVWSMRSGIGRVVGGAFVPLPAAKGVVSSEDVLVDMPGGQACGVWQGRIIVGRGNTLLFSRAFQYNKHDALRDFIRLPSRISWVAPLPEGIYVGLRDRVVFLGGSTPQELSLRTVSGESFQGAAAVMSAAKLDPKIAEGAQQVAIWAEENGFVVGLPSGEVKHPQALSITGLSLTRGTITVADDRVTLLTG